MTYIAAAPVQVSSIGRGQACPDCGESALELIGLMYDDRTMRCTRCHDDAFFRDRPPEVRAKAEQHRDDVLRWMLTGQEPELANGSLSKGPEPE